MNHVGISYGRVPHHSWMEEKKIQKKKGRIGRMMNKKLLTHFISEELIYLFNKRLPWNTYTPFYRYNGPIKKQTLVHHTETASTNNVAFTKVLGGFFQFF